ncbi:MAG: LamG domain-containing protein [Phycisphaerales bacterium]|nr:LamG domain-containing protein [Phycisphaerales bacterium]
MSMIRSTRTGSIYLVTLITVAAITSMILIGVSLRSASSDQSAIIEVMTESNTDLLNAAEYAIEKISNDSAWATNAQKGVVFNPFALGQSTIGATVVDDDTDALPTDRTTNYRITVTSDNSISHSSSKFVFNCVSDLKVDYPALLGKHSAGFYWPMNEATGTATAIDMIGNIDGTYLEPKVVGTGTNNEGGVVPVFANSNDSLEVPYSPLLIESEGAVSLWMNSSNTDKFGINIIMGMLYSSDSNPTINLSSFGTTLTAYISEDGSLDLLKTAQTSSDAFSPNTWHHIMMTWGSSGLQLYVDGVLKASNDSNTDGLATARKNQGDRCPLYIGSGYNLYGSTSPTPAGGFDGAIAHVSHFYAQPTASQVAEIAAVRPDSAGGGTTTIVNNSWVQVYE